MIGEWKKDEASDSSVAAGEAATTAPRLGARLLGRLGLDLPRWVRGVLLLADPGMTPPISGTVSSSKFGVVLRPPPFKWLWLIVGCAHSYLLKWRSELCERGKVKVPSNMYYNAACK